MGRTECVRKLLAAGAKRELKEAKGKTALNVAEQKGKREVVEYLQSLGAR